MKISGLIGLLTLVVALAMVAPGHAALFVQCPADTDGIDTDGDGNVANDHVCKHFSAGDGFAKMADGKDQYIFSFGSIPPSVPVTKVVAQWSLKQQLPAPTIAINQGQKLFLTITNVGMVMRPDLFDTHSVHWHGFPNAAPVFDGLPEASGTVNMGASFTYFYNAEVPGTYFFHCHVEATEHMQMGMIGNLWVHPRQNGTSIQLPPPDGRTFTRFVYNDGDGSTGYHVAYPLLLTAFDSEYHDAHVAVQPLPFAAMEDNYPMINGRGYPDTINPNPIMNNATAFGASSNFEAQLTSTLITASSGQRILLRVANVSTTHIYSIATTLGIPFRVVGAGAERMISSKRKNVEMITHVLTVGGGEHFDVLLDTRGVAPGTYFLYATELSNLSNGPQERGGLMTEIVIN